MIFIQNYTSEANIKKNKVVSTKWSYQNELSFSNYYFVFTLDIPTTQITFRIF